MLAKKFRKKPVIIEAMRFAGNIDKVSEWCPVNERAEDNSWFTIPTLEGDMKCNLGDWIIKGVDGEFYPCKGSIFAKTYEEITEEQTR
jgi:hypothetical protein